MSSSIILHSIKWSTLGEIASKVLPPLFYVVTARLLTPEDFGIVATSSMIVALASILLDSGFSKVLIQNQEFDIKKMSNIVLYSNIILSVLIYLVLFFSSDLIASFFHDERVSNVLKVSGLSIIIGSLMSVPTALFQKHFEFKKLFYSRFVGAIIPGIISVILAYYSYGYWALVYGSITSMFLQALILWKISNWRPSWTYDVTIAKEMFHFSKWAMLTALLSWFFMWGDAFVLGFFFTSHELGLYRTGNYFVGTIIGFVTAPIVPVMYSYFSKIQYNKENVKKALMLSSKVVSFFVLPVGLGLFIMQNPISGLIFGQKWEGIAPIIGYLAIQQSLAWIVGLNGEAYKAIGRPDIETKTLLFAIPIYLTVYIITAKINFETFILSRILLVFYGFVVHFYYSKNFFKTSYFEYISNIKFILFPSIFIFLFFLLLMRYNLISYYLYFIFVPILLVSYFIYSKYLLKYIKDKSIII